MIYLALLAIGLAAVLIGCWLSWRRTRATLDPEGLAAAQAQLEENERVVAEFTAARDAFMRAQAAN